MKEVDARGLQCPKPLMMAKKELDGGCDSLLVKVSNEAAVSNLQHLAGRMARPVSVEQEDDFWNVRIGGTDGEEANAQAASCECAELEPYAVFVGKDYVGDGNLGQELDENGAVYPFGIGQSSRAFAVHEQRRKAGCRRRAGDYRQC